MWLIWVIFIKKDLGLIESVFASDLLFYLIVRRRKSLAACFCFCEVWHTINGFGRNRLVAVLRNQVSCGLLFLHTCPSLLCSPTHRLWRFKPDLQASFSVLWAGIVSLDKHSQREGCQADVLVQPYCFWVQTQFGFTVLTNRTVGITSIWADYSAARSNVQGLFFYCKWLSLLLQATTLFFWGGGGCFCHPHTLQQQYLHPEPHPLLQRP